MDKRIGNVYLIALTLCAISSAHLPASMSLVAKDMYGKHIQQAEVGMPFTVEVQVVDGPAYEPTLDIPQEVHVLDKSVSSSYRSINGKTSGSRTYTYRMRIDKEGSFIIGPAQIVTGQPSTMSSGLLKMQVTKDAVATAPLKKPFFLESLVHPSTMYVGQQVTFMVRFYYASDAVTLEQLEDPVFNDCYATKMKGPFSGAEKRDGIDYKYLEWRSIICPKKAGSLVIPALAGNIAVSGQNSRYSSTTDMFSLIESMFGGGRIERHYAQAVTIEVSPLPDHNGPVHGVGSFTSYTAKVNSKTGSVGEGIVLTLELIGTGNTQAMVHPELIVPEHINYYDSHAKEKFLSDIIKKKDFEYILQFLEPGDYTIPKQNFTFFDPHTKKYKTLTTAPVQLSITGVAQKLVETKEQDVQPAQQVEQSDDDQLAPIYKASWRAGMPRRFMPWMWYNSLLLGLIGMTLCVWVYRRWAAYRDKYATYYRHKYAFKTARKAIAALRVGDDAAVLYGLIKQLFADRLQVPEALVSSGLIEETLQKRGMSDEQQRNWQEFFDQITRAHFSSTTMVTFSLKQEAQAWLDRLQKVLP